MDRRTGQERYAEARRRLARLPSGNISASDIDYAVDEILSILDCIQPPALRVTTWGVFATVTNQGGSMFDDAEQLALSIEENIGKLREAIEDGDLDEAIVVLSQIQLTVKSLQTELHSLPVAADVGEPESED